MPASFYTALKQLKEPEKGARTIKTVKETAVIGLVGTAPIQDVKEENRTVNEPTIILNEIDAVKYFGTAKRWIYNPSSSSSHIRSGSGGCYSSKRFLILINTETVSDVTKGDIMGEINPTTGKRTGRKHLKIVIPYWVIILKQLLHLYIQKILRWFLQ